MALEGERRLLWRRTWMFGADGVIDFCRDRRRRRRGKVKKLFPERGKAWSGGKLERGKS